MYAQSHNNRVLAFWGATLFMLMCAWGSVTHAQEQSTTDTTATTQTTATTPPSSAGLSRDGIFGCRAAQYANIGTLTAIGGVYVPVNDAAVTLNTGYLVYKECVLDGVVSAIKNDIAAGLTAGTVRAIETSRGGNKQYYTNREDLRADFDAIVVTSALAINSGSMCTAYKDRVARAVARDYYKSSRESASESMCPFAQSDSERAAIVAGAQPVNWKTFMSLVDPRGYELGAYNIEKAKLDAKITQHELEVREQLGWGDGFFPAYDTATNPLDRRIITPSSVIASSLQQMLGVGTQILVNANEIDQINGALQAGLQTSLVTDTIRGLSGLSQPQNGQSSYIDRMTSEASSAVRSSAVNAALSILGAARQVETAYKNAKEGIATALTDAINKLRAAENTCWDLIIPKVKERAQDQGVSLRIATSTEFSQKVIDENIQSLAGVTVRDIRASEQALSLINELITSVTNTSSAAAQRSALERLDSMVSNNQLHSTSEAQNAQKQKDEVVSAIAILVEDTLKEWGDSQDSSVGWCNVNNTAVIDMWLERWKN